MPRRKVPAQRRKSRWNANNILSNPKSPVATCDLRTVLSHPLAWSSLTIEEKREILSLFPDKAHTLEVDTDDARVNFDTLMNDDGFRADCAAYVGNLARGRHDPTWLEDAWSAHERRQAGDFDEFLRQRFEQEWGDMPETALEEIRDGAPRARKKSVRVR